MTNSQRTNASSIAIEQCEKRFPSPCSQVGCLHESTAEYTIRERTNTSTLTLSTPDPKVAFSSDPVPDVEPYRTPHPNPGFPFTLASERSARHVKGGGGDKTLGTRARAIRHDGILSSRTRRAFQFQGRHNKNTDLDSAPPPLGAKPRPRSPAIQSLSA